MVVTIEELQDFIEVFNEQGIEKISDRKLKKAIRRYWNVASKPTVESRIETLKEEGYISKVSHSEKWNIEDNTDSDFEELFAKRGKEE